MSVLMAVVYLLSIYGFGAAISRCGLRLSGGSGNPLLLQTLTLNFFLGLVGQMVLLNLIQLTGWPVPVLVIQVVLMLFAAYFLVWLLREWRQRTPAPTQSGGWFWWVLLTAVALQWLLLWVLNAQLPLVAWDAWVGWAAKAKLWYEQGLELATVSFSDWIGLSDARVNQIAHYPDGVSLIYYAFALFAGWNESVLNALWPLLLANFTVYFYHSMRARLHHPLLPMGLCFVLLSIPFLQVHVVMAGYADLWMAMFLFLAIHSLQTFLQHRHWRTFLLALVFICALPMIKLEGWLWLCLLLFAWTLKTINPVNRLFYWACVLFLLGLWLFFGGLEFDTAIGPFILRPDLISIPNVIEFRLYFTNAMDAFANSLWISQNWSLLWYSLLAYVVFNHIHRKYSEAMLYSLFLNWAFVFILILFFLTDAASWAQNYTTLNRFILHIVPVYLFIMAQYLDLQLRLPSPEDGPTKAPLQASTGGDEAAVQVDQPG